MTAARRRQKSWRRATAVAVVTIAVIVAVLTPPLRAAVTERIVLDPDTGLALSGFDPVAYFTDRKPRLGSGAFEYPYDGAVWRFCNDGNRAAFMRDPNVYAPRFGGYDPQALARGVAVPGHPLIWLIVEDRLYLFSSVRDRDAFAADPVSARAAAARGWQDVVPTLVP